MLIPYKMYMCVHFVPCYYNELNLDRIANIPQISMNTTDESAYECYSRVNFAFGNSAMQLWQMFRDLWFITAVRLCWHETFELPSIYECICVHSCHQFGLYWHVHFIDSIFEWSMVDRKMLTLAMATTRRYPLNASNTKIYRSLRTKDVTMVGRSIDVVYCFPDLLLIDRAWAVSVAIPRTSYISQHELDESNEQLVLLTALVMQLFHFSSKSWLLQSVGEMRKHAFSHVLFIQGTGRLQSCEQHQFDIQGMHSYEYTWSDMDLSTQRNAVMLYLLYTKRVYVSQLHSVA